MTCCKMKSHTSITTSTSLTDGVIVQSAEESGSATSLSTIFYHEPSWPTLITTEPEPLIPCYIYHYPIFQMSCEQFHSLISICPPSMTISSSENISYYTEYPTDSLSYVSSPILTDSGFSEELVKDGIPGNDLPNGEIEYLYQMTESYPIVTEHGAVSILLRHLVKVEISPKGSVFLSMVPADCIAAVNSKGDKSCIIHPNGRVFHDGEEIHMTTLNRKAKICKKGIIFTSSDLCLTYLVDESGTKTTAERFRDLSQDFSFQVFYHDTQLRENIEQCLDMVDKACYKTYKNGDEVWQIGGFRIKQDKWGDVKVSRFQDQRIIKASPTNGQVLVKTKMAEINVGRYPNNYFLARKDAQIVTASVRGFNVQNGTQKAGINSFGKVILR